MKSLDSGTIEIFDLENGEFSEFVRIVTRNNSVKWFRDFNGALEPVDSPELEQLEERYRAYEKNEKS